MSDHTPTANAELLSGTPELSEAIVQADPAEPAAEILLAEMTETSSALQQRAEDAAAQDEPEQADEQEIDKDEDDEDDEDEDDEDDEDEDEDEDDDAAS